MELTPEEFTLWTNFATIALEREMASWCDEVNFSTDDIALIARISTRIADAMVREARKRTAPKAAPE